MCTNDTKYIPHTSRASHKGQPRSLNIILVEANMSIEAGFIVFFYFQDFDVHGIAPRAVSTKEEFSQSRQQGIKRAAADVHHEVIPGQSALQGLIVPAHSTIGARLLRALGWKEGEGLGPKVMKYGPRQGLVIMLTGRSYMQFAFVPSLYLCLFWHVELYTLCNNDQ